MQNYVVFIDKLDDKTRPNSEQNYQIAISPSSRTGGAMGVKHDMTEEACASSLRRYFGFTEAAIERFFAEANTDRHLTLIDQPLSDQDAAYFNWLPEYNRH
jgi:hypothetical protein